MAVYLLDTKVVSELRRWRPQRAVLAWIADVPAEQLFISDVTVGETQAGIELTREQDDARARELEVWLDRVVASYGVVPMDAPAVREWLMHRRSETLAEDAMIAATAAVMNPVPTTASAPTSSAPSIMCWSDSSRASAGSRVHPSTSGARSTATTSRPGATGRWPGRDPPSR